MAEITFNKVGEQYVAEFEATADFNLHIEGVLPRQFTVFQRSAGGKYDVVRDVPSYPPLSSVFDYDFTALVYPKYIKIVSEVEPTYAEVVTDGEITEIKSQSKEVEIVANGTTNITPDAGYSYLSGVNVKVNVPQEGGGGASVLQPNDVNFYDYDGTLLYSYTYEEACKLKSLPPAPQHDGLVFQEWNYTLEDIREQGIKYFSDEYGIYQYVGDLTIGGVTYQAWNTNGNYSEGYWALLVIGEPVAGGSFCYAVCDNGDGTGWYIETDDDGNPYLYEILNVEVSGKADIGACVYDGEGNQVYHENVLVLPRETTEIPYYDNRYFKVISIPATEIIADDCFSCCMLEKLVIPRRMSTQSGGYGIFYSCSIKELYINNNIINSWFFYCPRVDFGLQLPDFITRICDGGFYTYRDGNIGPIKMPKYIERIDGYFWESATNNGYCATEYDFTQCLSIPQIESSAFSFYDDNFKSTEYLRIIVRDDMYDEWVTATNWVSVSNCIVKYSDYMLGNLTRS